MARKTLVDARDRIAREGDWARWGRALDSDGWGSEPLCPDTVRWDAIGALEYAAFYNMDLDFPDVEKTRKEAYTLLCKARDELFPGLTITQINGRLGHKSILKLYDRAIELAPKG